MGIDRRDQSFFFFVLRRGRVDIIFAIEVALFSICQVYGICLYWRSYDKFEKMVPGIRIPQMCEYVERLP